MLFLVLFEASLERKGSTDLIFCYLNLFGHINCWMEVTSWKNMLILLSTGERGGGMD